MREGGREQREKGKSGDDGRFSSFVFSPHYYAPSFLLSLLRLRRWDCNGKILQNTTHVTHREIER
jgi:hypothetical protein